MKSQTFLAPVGLIVGWLLFTPFLGQASESFTNITMEKAVHFSTPEGKDVFVQPGTYDVEADDNQLRLSSKIEGSIFLPARQGTHEESISTPLALSFSSESDMHYLALLHPGGESLEAVGSYSGVQTRGLSFFGTPPTFTKNQQQAIKAFARKLARTLRWNRVKSDWTALVQKLKQQKSIRTLGDVNSLVFFVMREATLDAQRNYKFARNQFKKALQFLSNHRETMTKTARAVARV